MGEDPVMSEPNQSHIIEALEKLDFLVVQEIFMSETAKLADVILPAASFAEKDGTFTNSERRVQRVRKAIDSPGECRPDWRIICDVAHACGYEMSYPSPKEVWDEIAALTPSMNGIRYDRIEEVGIQWPCPTLDHPGTQYLHKGVFARGKGEFAAIGYRPPAETPDSEFPFILSTGRTLYHYNAGNMTRKSEISTDIQAENFVEVNADDAEKLSIQDGASVKVATRRGDVNAVARVSGRVRPGVIWMPFHFAEDAANRLTNSAFDNVTWTGEYKVCAARIEVGGDGHGY